MARAESIVLLNTGHGKGKSSAAFGVMGRGWARGWRVGVVQFVKGGKWKTGERKLADHLGIEWHTLGDGFTWESDGPGRDRRQGPPRLGGRRGQAGFGRLRPADPGRADLRGELRLGARRRRGRRRAAGSPRTNVVITGRDAAPELIEVADTVTEMRKVKHAYDRGIKAKKGIEY